MTTKPQNSNTHTEDNRSLADVSPAGQNDIDESYLKDLVAEAILIQQIKNRIAKRKANEK